MYSMVGTDNLKQ